MVLLNNLNLKRRFKESIECLNRFILRLVNRFEEPRCLIILCFLFASILFIIAYENPTNEHDNILYFLSSISQCLAAIFALIFTVTFFVVQTTNKQVLISKVFDKWTMLYMVVFGIAIALPLIQLVVSPNYLPFDKIKNLSLAIDLSLAFFCILSIVPYSIRVNQIMKYAEISRLSNDISEAINLKLERVIFNKTDDLIKLAGMNSKNENENNEIINNEIINKVVKTLGGTVDEDILLLDYHQEIPEMRGSSLQRAIDFFSILQYNRLYYYEEKDTYKYIISAPRQFIWVDFYSMIII